MANLKVLGVRPAKSGHNGRSAIASHDLLD